MMSLKARKSEGMDSALIPNVFDRLLSTLDPDREKAGEIYEALRQKLLKFFEWRGAPFPEELTDRTIDRVARKLDEGETIRAKDPAFYFFGVAKNILLEYWNEHGREKTLLRTLSEREEASSLEPERERRLGCLERCLAKLPPESRELILRYYQGRRREKIDNRKAIAARLGLPINALRIRACRLRSRLESCVRECLERSLRSEMDSITGHKEGEDERS